MYYMSGIFLGVEIKLNKKTDTVLPLRSQETGEDEK